MFQKIKSTAKYILNLYGIEIYNTNYRTIPLGCDWRYDISYYSHQDKIKVVFDVGANIGQTVNQIIPIFPTSKIYCFEPIPSTFKVLCDNTKNLSNVKCFEIGLGDISGEFLITSEPLSGQNTFLLEAKTSEYVTSVKVISLDEFCESENITSISVLKIDTEGFECKVLSGACNMLSSKQIDFILTEVDFGKRPDNDPHGNFFEIFDYLKTFGYDVVAFYPDGLDKHGWRWGNVLFKSNHVLPRKNLIRRHNLKEIINLHSTYLNSK